MQSYKTHALIIKRTNLGESDRIVTAYSLDLGKIKFVAKGVRKIKSKLAGSLEPFYFSELILSQGKSLDILTSASILNTSLPSDASLETIKVASFFAELIDKTIPENSPNELIYDLLKEVFSEFKNDTDLNALRAYFESKYYQLSGLFPETTVCIKCGERPIDDLFFSASGGGIIDSRCRLSFPDNREISFDAAKIWRFMSENMFCDVKRIKLPSSLKKELVSISDCYLYNVTQRNFNSDKI
jgi:DNA repair protein RecO (recombination protein O)